jgi:hypothetical protein
MEFVFVCYSLIRLSKNKKVGYVNPTVESKQ